MRQNLNTVQAQENIETSVWDTATPFCPHISLSASITIEYVIEKRLQLNSRIVNTVFKALVVKSNKTPVVKIRYQPFHLVEGEGGGGGESERKNKKMRDRTRRKNNLNAENL